jgi:hypothetical protein
MLKISIIEGHHQPISRTTKNGVMWNQDGYVHLGGAYPSKMKITLESPAAAYGPGEYELSPESFRVGQYGDLEVNRFGMKMVPISLAKSATSATGK